ncbi:hypothetical protein D3C86_1922590 [compost metagenome]
MTNTAAAPDPTTRSRTRRSWVGKSPSTQPPPWKYMNTGKVPFTPAGRTMVKLMSWPSTVMVFSLTSALGSVSFTPA